MTYTLTYNRGLVGSTRSRSTTECVPESLVLFAQILNKRGFTIRISQGRVAILPPPPGVPFTTMGWRLIWSWPNTKTGLELSGNLLVVDGEDGSTMPSTSIPDGDIAARARAVKAGAEGPAGTAEEH